MNEIEHVVDMGEAPIQQMPRRVSFALRKESYNMVEVMLVAEVIQESSSPWASPVVLVKKKDQSL